ncbi:MAG: magnesium chelatase domain-containing protein [Patescibacteria group bacterium]
MSYVRLNSAFLQGLTSTCVGVEVKIESYGLPYFNIIGLADKSVDEAKERVRASIKSCGFDFPLRRITVNLFPAELHKRGSFFDLAICLGVLVASKQVIPKVDLTKLLIIGELTLNGELKAVKGVLPISLSVNNTSCKCLLIPSQNIEEAAFSKMPVFGAETLLEAVKFLKGILVSSIVKTAPQKTSLENNFEILFEDIQGNSKAKRALQIAAAGGHNLLLVGSPGSGKTLLSKSMVSILPPLSHYEFLESAKIYSACGRMEELTGAKDLLGRLQAIFPCPHYLEADHFQFREN